jgi:hypothetical protein
MLKMSNIEDEPSWRLHKKFQSSLELKVKDIKNQEFSDEFFM